MHAPGALRSRASNQGSACRALTSLVLVRRNLAWVRLASPSMFMVPMKLVLIVLMGLYLQSAVLRTQPLLRLVGRVWESRLTKQHRTCMPVYRPKTFCICDSHAKMCTMQLCEEQQNLAALCRSVYPRLQEP